jgi:pyruvate formate lyase activating enzyme
VATTLEQALDARTRPGELYERLDDENNIRCFACGLRCLIRDGRRGICRVRYNEGGKLMVPWNYVAALQVDPTEKKPLFHVFPGSESLTFGMLGCDLHCDYCQNWITSQALRDEHAGIGPNDITSDAIVELGVRRGAKLVVSSYNEPLITAEWSVEIFEKARRHGFRTAYISNGNATPEVLQDRPEDDERSQLPKAGRSARAHPRFGASGPRARLLGRDRHVGRSRLQRLR